MAVLLVEGASMFLVSVPLSVFGNVPHVDGAPRYRLLAAQETPAAITTNAGITMSAPHGLTSLSEADIVVVPTWSDPTRIPSRTLLDALRQAHDRGTVVVGLCLGAFVLAHAGLLDGLAATTH